MQACTLFQFKTDERKCFLTQWVVNFWSLLPLALWKQTVPIRLDNRLDSWSIKGRGRDVLSDISPSETVGVGDYKVRGFRRVPRPHSLLLSLWEPAQPDRPRCDLARCFLCSYQATAGHQSPWGTTPRLGCKSKEQLPCEGQTPRVGTWNPQKLQSPASVPPSGKTHRPKHCRKKLVFFILSCLHTLTSKACVSLCWVQLSSQSREHSRTEDGHANTFMHNAGEGWGKKSPNTPVFMPDLMCCMCDYCRNQRG